MATNLFPIQPTGIRPSTTVSTHRTSDIHRTTRISNTGDLAGKWWTPLFGWSSDPDYIDASKKQDPIKSDPDPIKSRFAPGCFTEEKAKRLRIMTNGTTSFHDVMYHSAIASRLASDFSARFRQ